MTRKRAEKEMFSVTGNLAFKTAVTVLLLISTMAGLVFSITLYHAEKIGVYSVSREENEKKRLENISTDLSYQAFYWHHSFDGKEESIIDTGSNQLPGRDFYYAIYAEDGQLLAGWPPDFSPAWQNELLIQHESDNYVDEERRNFTGQLYTVKGYLDGDGTYKDEFYWNEKELDFLYGWQKFFPWLAAAGIISTAGLLALLAVCAGRRPGQEAISRRRFDRLPLDLLLAGAAVLLYFLLRMVLEPLWRPLVYYYTFSDFNVYYYPLYSGYRLFLTSSLAGVISLAAAVLVMELLFVTLVVRLKTKTLLKETLLYRFFWQPLIWLGKKGRFILARLPLVWKSGLLIIGWILFELYLMQASYWTGAPLVWLVSRLVLAGGLIFLTAGFSVVRQGTQQLANGRLEHQIKTDNLLGELKTHAGELNQISQVLAAAVEERMKSERFRTELITNVSHDLKTPLTSIVNYVDLLKQHETDPAKVQEYLLVLDRHSQRLKKLTEDLVEASKASAGNIQLELAPVDAAVFLAQLAGEYSEKFAGAGLDLVVEQPQDPVWLMADGRQLWRILDNLLENACKYSQAGTRVYLNLTASPDRVIITLKNISRAPLNIPANALLERFVRGDQSRSSEGSGLGISIAKSLCELQGASMDLSVDGDLFKVDLSFPRTTPVAGGKEQA